MTAESVQPASLTAVMILKMRHGVATVGTLWESVRVLGRRFLWLPSMLAAWVLLAPGLAFAQSPPFQCLIGVASVPTLDPSSTSAAVGDYTFNCTGGTPGSPPPVTVQLVLDTTIINSGSWNLTDGTHNYAGVYGTPGNPGQVNGVNFPNVPFPEPGPGSSLTWTVQNILVNPSLNPGGFQYMGEVSFTGNPTLSAANPNQLVAMNSSTPPVANSISPSSAAAGGSAFTLTVNGSGFVSDAAVNWNASALPTTFVNSGQLMASVAASLIATAGSATVTVTSSGLTSTGLPFTITPQTPPIQPGSIEAQTITFGALNNESLGVPPFTLSATASSGLTVAFGSATPSVCTVSGNIVTILGAGTCSITASQAGNANYAAAAAVTHAFMVLSVTPSGLTTYTYRGNPFTGAQAPYSTANFITGYFTVPTLAANLTAVNVISKASAFSFTDGGVNTLTPSNALPGLFGETQIIVSTDSLGNITSWNIFLITNVALPNDSVILTCSMPACPHFGDQSYLNNGAISGSNTSDFGTWTASSNTPLSCSYALAPPNQVVSSGATTGTVGVLAGLDCPWTAASASPFLAITSGANGTGSGTVQFASTANTGTAARAGTLIIAGQTATIDQAGTAPLLQLIPISISVQWTQQSPSPATIPLSIFTQANSLAFTASAASSGNWLSVSPASGNAPATIFVTINPSSLAPGPYQGTVTVTAPAASPPSQTFTVLLTVLAAGSPAVAVTTKSLSYSFVQGAQQAEQQTVPIGNSGSGTLLYQASASTSSGGNWLSVTQDGSGAMLVTPDLLTVTVNPGALAVGTYTGLITITANATVTIPVTVTVSAVQQSIALTENALTFTAVAGGGTVPSQTFGIVNAGAGVMDWSVSSSVTDTSDWLSASPSFGNTDAASRTVPLVVVSVNPANLAAGQYSGQVQMRSASANNSPEYVSVILSVLPSGSNPGAVVLPEGLIFTQAVGGAAPGSQTITVSNLTGSAETFATQAATTDGANWLSVTLASGTVTPTQTTTLTVNIRGTGLAAGTRQGIVTLFFEDGSVRTVNVVYVLAAGGVTSQRTSPGHPVPQLSTGSCTPTKLLPLLTSLGAQFTVPAAWPNTLEAQVVDDCGNPQVSGTVVASFTNSDPPVPLISLRNGNWTGTWQVTNNNVSNVSVTVNADNPSLGISGTTSVSGSLQNSVNAPVIAAGGVFNAASYAPSAPLAPGSMISIFGSNLANGTTPVNSFPLPEQLSGTLVTIGGEPAPLLYAGAGQLNAVVPFGLAVNTNTQVIVRQGNAYTAPVPITLAAANPAIFTSSGSGAGQGIIIRPDGNYAQPGTPAQAGDELLIYAAGLGVTNPQATDADPATTSPLLYAAGTATMTIGGQPARVDFAGLAPGFAGLYQINAAVPAGVHGNTLPVVLSVGGQPGPPVTMAVQ